MNTNLDPREVGAAIDSILRTGVDMSAVYEAFGADAGQVSDFLNEGKAPPPHVAKQMRHVVMFEELPKAPTIAEPVTETSKIAPAPFAALADEGFTSELLPILPPGAKLSPRSKVKPNKIGKIPGRLRDDGWVGFLKWSEMQASPSDIAEWETWEGAGLGIQTRRTPAVDIDVMDSGLADLVEKAALRVLGPAPKRVGQAPKCLLVYRTDTPRSKITVSFKRGTPDGIKRDVEILGEGQQFVAHGIHPKTGKPYEWTRGNLAEIGRDGLTLITPEKVDAFLAELGRIGEAEGFTVERTGGSTRKQKTAGTGPAATIQVPPERAITRARDYLATAPLNDDPDAYIVACRLKDFGVDEATAIELMRTLWDPRCDPPRSDNTVDPVRNAFRYGLDPPGVAAPEADFKPVVPAAPVVTDADEDQEPLDLFGDASLTREPQLKREMLPKAIGDFAFDAAERLGVEPSMVAIPALVVSAAALDDGIQIQPREHDTEWTESGRLWAAVITPPGGRKTPAINTALKPYHKIEERWQTEDAAKAAAFDAARARAKEMELTPAPLSDRPTMRRLTATDATMEQLAYVLAGNPRGILLIRDELMGWIGSFDAYHGNGVGKDRTAALELANGGPRQIDRVRQGGSVRVPNWGASVLGGVQPDRLREAAPKLLTDGLLQRILLWNAKTLGRGVDRVPDRAAIGAYAATLDRLLDIDIGTAQPVTLSADAQVYRLEVEQVAEAMAALPTTATALCDHLGKWPGIFARLLLVIHAIEYASIAGAAPSVFDSLAPEVSGGTARRARDLMLGFFLPSAERIYGDFFRSTDVDGSHARWIAGYILTRKLASVSAREIKRAYREVRSVADDGAIDRAMGVLRRARWVSDEQVEKKGSRIWPVNQIVHVRFTERAAAETLRREAERRKIDEAAREMNRAYKP